MKPCHGLFVSGLIGIKLPPEIIGFLHRVRMRWNRLKTIVEATRIQSSMFSSIQSLLADSSQGHFFLNFTLFYFTMLYWFCHTSTWIRHECTWVPKREPPSHLTYKLPSHFAFKILRYYIPVALASWHGGRQDPFSSPLLLLLIPQHPGTEQRQAERAERS